MEEFSEMEEYARAEIKLRISRIELEEVCNEVDEVINKYNLKFEKEQDNGESRN